MNEILLLFLRGAVLSLTGKGERKTERNRVCSFARKRRSCKFAHGARRKVRCVSLGNVVRLKNRVKPENL
jgi:hypothetical protein